MLLGYGGLGVCSSRTFWYNPVKEKKLINVSILYLATAKNYLVD